LAAFVLICVVSFIELDATGEMIAPVMTTDRPVGLVSGGLIIRNRPDRICLARKILVICGR